ncbi:beta-2-microglobulin-like [Heterodontus francisci]|uniref:beta-2-microglobulin-like n=1 Tax=Heterodontus francisci TaxID=7792 RepID=UPI00355BE4EA
MMWKILGVLASMVALSLASAPQVQVYTYKPIKDGEANVLLCHAKEFSPPNIKLLLFENGVEIPHASQSDLSFEADWSFKLTKYVDITAKSGAKYSCKMEHNGLTKVFELDSY